MDRQQLGETGYLEHGGKLFGKSRQRKTLPLVSPVNEDLHERSHACGIEKRHAAQIKNQACGRIRP